MKIKNTLISILIVLFAINCVMLSGFSFFKKPIAENQQIQKNTNNDNKLWCVTFQLVWNDFTDKLSNGKPVQFVGGNPPIADELNKRLYTKDILNENSYYITNGAMTTKLKKQIEKTIWKKFHEKSDILDSLNWSNKENYLFYAILKKDFNFLTAFDRYNPDTFNNSSEKVKYFGIKEKSDKKLKENISVLFYKSEDEFAVKLLTKENEDVILLRTKQDGDFETLYSYVNENIVFDEFTKKDTLKVPDIDVNEIISYPE